jgi:hypothetical protein
MPMVKATWAKSRYVEFLCVRVADVDACAAQAAVLIGVPQGENHVEHRPRQHDG